MTRKTVLPVRSLSSYKALEAQLARVTEERDAFAEQLKKQKEKPVLPLFVEALQDYRAFFAGELDCIKGDVFRVDSVDQRWWYVVSVTRLYRDRLGPSVICMPRRIAQAIDGIPFSF